MADLKITTVNNFDNGGVFPHRTIRVGNKAVQTPAAAKLPRDLRQDELFHPESDGICELYRTVGGDDLDEAMLEPEGAQINKDLEKQQRRVKDGELAVTFTKYTETQTLEPAHASYLAEIHAAYSDIITVPLMPKLVGNIEDDLSDPNYRSLKQSINAFLHQVGEKFPDRPVMGVIPRLGWEFIDDLLGVYQDYDIDAYAFDFNRCKVTTGTQVAMIRPLMQNIANRGVEEHVLFYAINPSPGRHNDDVGARPAADIASLGMGFDIVGGCHVPPNVGPDGFEDMESENEETEFRLFDRTDWVYRDIPVSELGSWFPEESAFDAEQVARQTRNSPGNAKYRLQNLVNSEQQALAAADLRSELENGDAFSMISQKGGVTPQAESAFQDVREGFVAGREQTGLDDF